MWNQIIMVDNEKGAKLGKCGAPAAGCFGQTRPDEAYRTKPKRSAAEVYLEWKSVADRFYQMGYRDGADR